jgi:hypothetical protein
MNADKKSSEIYRYFLLSAFISVHLRFQNLLYFLGALGVLGGCLFSLFYSMPNS